MKRIMLKLTLAFSFGFCLLPVSGRAVQVEKAGPFVQSEPAIASLGGKVPIIVRMKNPVEIQPLATQSNKDGPLRKQARAILIHTLKARAEQSQRPLQRVLDRHGITKFRQLWLINGLALQATPAQIEEISRMPEVASIVVDQVIELPEIIPSQTSGPVEPNIDLVSAPELWALGYVGQGVTVAIVDSGVDINHPDLGPRWRGGTNSWFDPNDEHPFVPTDLDGHGTQVTGLILGGNNSGSYIGVAPDAEWIGVKIFNDDGKATSSGIHAGFQWILDPDRNPETDDAPDIVNSSWGFEDFPDLCDDLSKEFQGDVQAMKAAGIAVLFAAGNTGPEAGSSIAPANYQESFAVGSIGTFSSPTLISSFSARGPSACDDSLYPDVVAPGFLTRTSDLTSSVVNLDSYISVTGTSFSTPHASGVMALLLSAFPGIPISALETALKQSATDLGSLGADNAYGYGLINSLAAFNYLGGLEDIEVTDSISPETDNQVVFGSVAPGASDSASVWVRNPSSVPLILGAADISNVREPFSINSDACSNQILLAGETCNIGLQFAPTLPGSFSGSLVILSNVIGEERVSVTISGTGNTLPIAPQPLDPPNGATVDTNVKFTWLPASDADGDAVSQFLVYSPHADFSFSNIHQVDTIPAVVLAAGGLLLGALLAGLVRRRDLTLALIPMVMFLAMASCGGGGGGGGENDNLADAQSTMVSGLIPGVTYYWKMIAVDSHDAETQSAVRTILVQQLSPIDH